MLNMIRSNLHKNNVPDVESKAVKVSVKLDKFLKPQAPVDIKQLTNIWVKLLNIFISVQGQISKSSNKCHKSDFENRDLSDQPVGLSKLPSHLEVLNLHSSELQ